ncbi:MAG: hypothetical protein AB1611_11465 [bacterium]
MGEDHGVHGSVWTDGHFARFDSTVSETNKMTRTATVLLSRAWQRGLADRTNPFDEAIEQRWTRQWLFFANSVRFASAMQGPDYASLKNGWWDLSTNLVDVHRFLSPVPGD